MIQTDKLLHAAVSALLMACISACIGMGWAAPATLAIGFGKELYDKHFKGTGFSWADIIADIVGIAVGAFVFLLVYCTAVGEAAEMVIQGIGV